MASAAEELILKISGDAVGGQKAIQDIVDSVEKMVGATQNASGVTQTLDSVLGTLHTTTVASSQAMATLDQALRSSTTASSTASVAVQDLFTVISQGGKSWSEYGRAATDAWAVLRGLNASDIRAELNGVAQGAGLTVESLGAMGTAGAVVGAAMAGWKIGRAISEFFGLDKAIGDATARLIGFGDVVGQEAGAKQDSINMAIKRGADAMISYADALKFNDQWVRNWSAGAKDLADIVARQHAPEELAKQIRDWNAEIQKVVQAGSLDALKEGLNSHVISVKELSASYRISEGAISLLKQQMADETAAHHLSAAAAKRHVDELRRAAEEADRFAAQWAKLTGEVHKLEGGLFLVPDALHKIGRAFDETKVDDFSNKLAQIEQTAHIANFGFAGMTESLRHVGTGAIKTANELDGFFHFDAAPAADKIRSLSDTFDSAFANMPKLLERAFTGGGGMHGAVDAFGAKISNDLFGEKGAFSGATKAASGALSGMFGKTIGGALGAAIPGVGALIGPAMGKLFDLIGNFGGPSQQELDGRKIEASFEQSFGGFQKMMDAVGKVYETTGRGAQQAQADVKALMDAEKLGGDAAKSAIDKITRAFDEQKKKIADVSAGLKSATAGTNDFGASLLTPLQSIQDQFDKLITQTGKDDTSLAKLLIKAPAKNDAAAALYGLSLADQIFDSMKKAIGDESKIGDMNKKMATILTEVQPQFEHLGQYVAATFAAQIHEGASAFDAFASLAPSFKELQDGVQKFGLKSSATIDQLMTIQNVVGVNADVFKSVQSVTNVYDGLTQAGYVTKDLFVSFGEDISTQFNNLITRGAEGKTAMMLMQPQLQKLWEGQQKFGEVTDDATKKLLHQAVEQGIVGEQAKGVNDKILDVLLSIADVFGAKLPASLDVLKKQTAIATADVQKALDSIHAPTLSPVDLLINGHWNIPDAPDWGGAMARGGDFMVTRPTLFLAGEAGPERATFSGANRVGVGPGVTVNIEVDAAGAFFPDRATVDRLAKMVGDSVADKVRLNRHLGLRTN